MACLAYTGPITLIVRSTPEGFIIEEVPLNEGEESIWRVSQTPRELLLAVQEWALCRSHSSDGELVIHREEGA